eukprot:TRINITY_DN2481_c0_g1_i1.p1 TRINITY_DN2481_c0_g1~~TRINITY_DN2481_c0_g1_i1.p1  ORF type:complete len:537 (-),score=106.59 TRINITY_DN2481_c0_g1_i1:285-1811(-)
MSVLQPLAGTIAVARGVRQWLLAEVPKTSIVVVCFGLYSWYVSKFRRPRGAPTLPGYPFFGCVVDQLRAMFERRRYHWLHNWHKKLKTDTMIMVMPHEYWVETADPKNFEHVLKGNFDNYVKGPLWKSPLKDLLGDGIFNVDGEMWYHQRKLASQMFTQKAFKSHIWQVVNKNTAKVVELLRNQAAGEVIDIFNLLNRFTLDTIGEIGFAKSVGSLEDPETPFLRSFDRQQQICVLRFVNPLWKLQRFLGVGEEAEGPKHLKLMNDYAQQTVRELREDLDGEGGNSFVGLFLKDARACGLPYDDAFLRDMVINFVIAGRDTTAQALAWCLFRIMQNPAVQQKMREEIQEVCGEQDLMYDDLNRLKYVHAVINEALRLHPSVPLDAKVALADDTLPDGTWVPRGCVIAYNIYSMCRSTKLWGADAEVFRPERWLELKETPSPYVYPVFNAGPRECLGKRLSYVEMKALLVSVLRSVDLTLAMPAEDVGYDCQLTLGMQPGLFCTVTARG